VTNNGHATHAFAIQTPSGIQQTSSISPGASATLTVDIQKDGTYTFYCPVPGHRMLGMVGTLTVGSGGGSTSGASTSPTSSSGGAAY
jgi:uncharacterized cupredoxin-like copper-binding protein